MQALLSPEAAFERFFAHWYDAGALEARGSRAPQPGVVSWSEPGSPPSSVQPLSAEDQAAVDELLEGLIDAAEEDWPGLLGVERPVSPAWLDAFDRHYTPDVVAEVSTRADATEFGNEYLTLAGELGAVIARVLQTRRPQLTWIYEWPYWDSGLLDPATGLRLNVFTWSMARLTSSGVGTSSLAALDEGIAAIDEQARGEARR
jgi:hypothetical protein